MSNVLVDKNKIDLLANAISNKSGESLTLTLDEMVEAVDGIESGGGGITPTGNINITQAGVTDVTNYATATVPAASISDDGGESEYYTENNQRKYRYRYFGDYGYGGFISGLAYYPSTYQTYNAVPSGTTVTPTESSQTIGGFNYMMEGAVTVSAIPSNYVGSGITQRSSSDLTASGATVSVPSGYYASNASKAVTSGSAGTPTATKGTVSNHSISVTPSVTNTTGYITGSTKTGTAVSVSASELVSGTLSVTQNGTADVTNYAAVDVSVAGGAGMSISTSNTTLNAANSSISFTGLQDEPTSFVITTDADLATGAAPYKTATVVYDGTNVFGQIITNTNNAQVTYSGTGFSKSYNNGTLTVTGTGANFQANKYNLVYTYGGSSANIGTSDVQVGSGATSITFTDLPDEPSYFSLAFKSDFGTSSGYQRVITVVYDGSTTYGLAMDSGAHAATSWSYTYNAGTLTISSQGTNAGGYFHQPGYYQLTYGIGGTVEVDIQPLSVTTNGTYQQSGVAYSPVTVNVSGGGGSSVETKSYTNSDNTATSIQFTSLNGTPLAFFVRCATQMQSSSTTYYYVSNMRYNGTNVNGNAFRMGNTRQVTVVTSGYSYTYSNGTLTVTSSGSRTSAPGSFYNGSYELTYIY